MPSLGESSSSSSSSSSEEEDEESSLTDSSNEEISSSKSLEYSRPNPKPMRKSRKELKLSELIFKINENCINIEKKNDWNQLWLNLQSLDQVLMSLTKDSMNNSKNCYFVPMIYRLINEISRLAISDSNLQKKDKSFRRKTLNQIDAKGLILIKQKWSKLLLEDRWKVFNEIVNSSPYELPKIIQKSESEEERSYKNQLSLRFLSNLEKIILGDSDRLTLSQSELEEVPKFLLEIRETLDWYLSFRNPTKNIDENPDLSDKSEFSNTQNHLIENVLKSIKTLDLSHNKLTFIPNDLPKLFTEVTKLNLSQNPLNSLPPTIITEFQKLRTLKLSTQSFNRPNPLNLIRNLILLNPSPETTEPSSLLIPPSLSTLCLRKLYKSGFLIKNNDESLSLRPSNLLNEDDLSLKIIVSNHLKSSSICYSCDRLYLIKLESLFQSFKFNHFKHIVIGPIVLCKSCLIVHLSSNSNNSSSSSRSKSLNVEDLSVFCNCFICRSINLNQFNKWSVKKLKLLY